MKLLLGFILSLAVVTAEAATTKTTPAAAATVSTTAPTGSATYENAKTVGVSLYYSLGNQVELKAGSDHGTMNSRNPFGIGLQKTKIVKSDLGYHGGVFFETGHNIESFTINNIRQNYDDKGFSYLYVNPSATFGLNQNVYLIGGLNYTLPTQNIGGLTAKGDVGYQIGAGYQVNNGLSFETLYREINFRMGQSDGVENFDFDTARISGIMLKANILLE